jgi:hypothetical protein
LLFFLLTVFFTDGFTTVFLAAGFLSGVVFFFEVVVFLDVLAVFVFFSFTVVETGFAFAMVGFFAAAFGADVFFTALGAAALRFSLSLLP